MKNKFTCMHSVQFYLKNLPSNGKHYQKMPIFKTRTERALNIYVPLRYLHLTTNESALWHLQFLNFTVIGVLKFQVRHQIEGIKLKDGNQDLIVETESPSRESVGTSVEVQTGNSAEVFSVQEERVEIPHRMQQKARTQVLQLKVEQKSILTSVL